MKSWIRERRNLMIISMLALCMLALVIAGLQKGSDGSRPVAGPAAATSNPDKAVSAAPVSTPSPNAPADELFQLISHDKYRYFRVSEQNQYWDYKPGQSIWYSRGDATFILSLDVSGSSGISQQQIDLLRSSIAVTTTSGEPVSFTAAEGSGEQQLLISLKGSSASDLTVTFFSADQSQNKPVNIYYMKPFDYKITAERIPYSDQAFALSAQMIELPLPVRFGEVNEFVFQFTDEVDRTSVDELCAKKLKDASWKLDWIDNRTFRLTVTFKSAGKDDLIYLSADGIRNARGVELKTNRGIWLTPNALQGYALYDPASGKQTALPVPARPYMSLSIAPNQDWTLAGIGVITPLVLEPMYELLDRTGTVVHTFHTGETYLPKWLPGSAGFVYLDGKSGMRELSLYHIASDEKETVWQTPDSKGRIIAFDIDQATGRLAIAWGLFNDEGRMDIQIEVRKGLKDASPVLHKNVGTFRCMDGPCLSSVEFLNDGFLLVYDDEGYSALNLESGKTRQIVSHSANTKHTVLSIVPYRSKMWYVHMSEAGGKERWTWSDGDQEIAFTTSIGIPENASVLRGPYGSGSTALFYVEEKGWYRLDPAAKTFKQAREVPDTLDPKWIMDPFKGKLVVGVS